MKDLAFPLINEFVISVIRETRRPPCASKKQVAPAGVSVAKVSSAILGSPYPFDDYVRSTLSAISAGDIVLLATCSDFSSGSYCSVTYETLLEPKELPDGYDFAESNFTLDLEGKLLTELAEVPRYVYYNLRFYVPKDGLPKRVQKIVDRRRGEIDNAAASTAVPKKMYKR